MCDNQLCYPSHIAGLWSRVPRRPAGPRCDGRGAEAHPQGAQQVEVQHRHRQGEEGPARAAARRQQHEVHGEFSPACYSYNVLVSMWDEELEKIAQRHADQCNFDHDCSDCRRTSRYTQFKTQKLYFSTYILMWLSSVRFAVGQNLYIYRMMNRAPNNDWTRAITDWYDEVTLYSNEDVDRWKYHSETGHYTQVKRTFCISNKQVICDPNNIKHWLNCK